MSADHSYLLEKARKFCTYQERCFQDVRIKLIEWKATEKTIEKIIWQLEKEDYLNEERFAIAFSVSKFRQKKWGKNKIFYALQQKGVPEIYIQIGLNEINDEEQVELLKKLMKTKKYTDESEYVRNHKLVNYVVQKGFQASLAWKVIRGDI